MRLFAVVLMMLIAPVAMAGLIAPVAKVSELGGVDEVEKFCERNWRGNYPSKGECELKQLASSIDLMIHHISKNMDDILTWPVEKLSSNPDANLSMKCYNQAKKNELVDKEKWFNCIGHEPYFEPDKPKDPIKQFCQQEWETDYRMQEYCQEQQRKSYREVEEYRARHSIDLTNQSVDEIRKKPEGVIFLECLQKWSSKDGSIDHRMMDYCISKQYESYMRVR